MSDITRLVKKYLNPSLDGRKLTYYSAIGLEECCADATQIRAALQNAAMRLRQAIGDEAESTQVLKLLRQIQSILLDDAKRAAYDAKLKVAVTPNTIAKSEQSKPVRVAVPNYLPDDDPYRPFSAIEYQDQLDPKYDELLRAKRIDEWDAWVAKASPQRVTEQAEKQLNTVAVMTMETDEVVSDLAFSSPPVAVTANQSTRSEPMATSISSNNLLERKVEPRGSASSRALQLQIRQNRRRKNRIMTASILGVAASGVAIAGIFLWLNRRGVAELERQLAAERVSNTARNDALVDHEGIFEEPVAVRKEPSTRMNLGFDNDEPSGKVGDLPKFELSSDTDNPDSPTSLNDSGEKNATADKPSEPPMAVDETRAQPTTPSPEPPPVPTLTPTSTDERSAMVMPVAPETTAPPASPPMMQDAAMNNVDKDAWLNAIRDAKVQLIQNNPDAFEKSIQRAYATADEESEKLTRRLDMYGQLYTQGLGIVAERLDGLQAGEKLSYGSTIEAAVVESTESSLIVKLNGKNQKFERSKLPTALWIAILNSKFDDSPMSKAMRATLYTLDPRSSPVTKQSAAALFTEAEQADPKYAGLANILQEIPQP